MSITPQLALNALVFQLGWFLCVLGGDRVAVWVAIAVSMLHWLYISRERAEWLFIAVSLAIGIALDSALHNVGVLQFDAPTGFGVPLWLATVWLLFVTLLNYSLRWLQSRWRWAALLGALAAPLSYWAGVHLGAARFGVATGWALAILAACWGLLLPLLSAMMGHRTRILSLCKAC